MGGNFKFQVQYSFLEYFFFEIWRSKKRIALSGKKPPLVSPKILQFTSWILQQSAVVGHAAPVSQPALLYYH